MKLVSIDIETTGLDPKNCQILEIGAVCFDDSDKDFKPKTFHTYIWHDKLSGNPVALANNAEIIKKILELGKEECFTESNVAYWMYVWLVGECEYKIEKDNKIYVTVVGKNYAMFDHRFLKRLNKFNELIRVRNRVLDPSAFYTLDTDDTVPNLEECKKRSGIFEDTTVKHTALEDALDVMRLWVHGIQRARAAMALSDKFKIIEALKTLDEKEIRTVYKSVIMTIDSIKKHREPPKLGKRFR